MKISEVYPEYVFQRLGKYRVVAVDFMKGEYIDLQSRTVGQVLRLVEQASQGGIKFYQIEEA